MSSQRSIASSVSQIKNLESDLTEAMASSILETSVTTDKSSHPQPGGDAQRRVTFADEVTRGRAPTRAPARNHRRRRNIPRQSRAQDSNGLQRANAKINSRSNQGTEAVGPQVFPQISGRNPPAAHVASDQNIDTISQSWETVSQGTMKLSARAEGVAQVSMSKSPSSINKSRQGAGFLGFFQKFFFQERSKPKQSTEDASAAMEDQEVGPPGGGAVSVNAGTSVASRDHSQNVDESDCAIESNDEEEQIPIPRSRRTRPAGRDALADHDLVHHHANSIQIRRQGKPAWEQHRNGKVFMGTETYLKQGQIRQWEQQGYWGPMRHQSSADGYPWHFDDLVSEYDTW